MAWSKTVLVICLLVQLASCKPHRKRSHIKKTTVRACETAAAAMQDVLPYAGDVVGLPPGSFEELADNFISYDIFDPSERERIICSFEGLETLSEFLQALADLELDQNLVKVAYDYMSAASLFMKQYSLENLEYEWANVRSLRASLEVYQNLEAFGFIGLDPVGEQAAIDFALQMSPDTVLPEREPLSNLPLEDRCSQFTNSLRKVWNAEMRQSLKWNPNASQEVRAEIERWTGIAITDHDSVKALVCDLMGRLDSDQLDGAYEWIIDHRIFNHLLKTAYPYIQYGFEEAKEAIDRLVASTSGEGYPNNIGPYPSSGGRHHRRTSNEVEFGESYPYAYPSYGGPGYGGPGYGGAGYGGPGYGGPGYGGPGYGGPSMEDMLALYTNLQTILNSLEEMGLMSLSDDLRK